MKTSKTVDNIYYEQLLEGISHFSDLPLKITVHLGQRRMKVREILQLKTTSIVEIPKSAGENIDIHVNGKLIAFGEVLDLEGNAGIRLTDLYTPS